MSHEDKQDGFTLVELTLAMAFIGILLLAITMMILQIGTVYQKGVVLKQVNQAGQEIVRDMQGAFASSPVLSIDTAKGTGIRMQKDLDGKIAGGRLCLGTVSYVWNLGRYDGQGYINRYDSSSETLRFVKIADRSRSYCQDVQKNVSSQEAIELLPSGDSELVVHNSTIRQIAYNPARQTALYALSIELGTNDRDMITVANSGAVCRPSAAMGQAGVSPCAINRFDFTVQSGGQSGVSQQ